MLEQLLNHIQHHNLCKTSDKILLAVSGGLDSMVMLDLFYKAGFTFGVAHCNFQLRGNDSLEDELLVHNTCEALKIPFHCRRFDTSRLARETSRSIQITARELRYEFFQTLKESHAYQYVATAHHHNDNLETLLLNLTRGTGIDGLAGIPVKNDHIIRPLLFATRGMLHSFGVSNRLTWREDASNLQDDYQRNFIRHHVIPRLLELNPNLEDTSRSTIQRLAGTRNILQHFLSQLKETLFTSSQDKMYVDIAQLKKYPNTEVVIWELIKDFGFNFEQCKQLLQEHQAGKQFHSEQYVLTVDRAHYILEQKKFFDAQAISIGEDHKVVNSPYGTLTFSILDRKDFVLKKVNGIAQLDAAKIRYPLQWRSWRHGDSLIPLGMHQTKKVSDILIDDKVSLPDKPRVTVVESAGEIVWLVGSRIHDHFKVTDQTTRVLLIDHKPAER